MYKVLIGFLLAASVAAKAQAQVPADIVGLYGAPQEPEPRPCCAPNYFTYESSHFLTFSFGDSLGVSMQRATGAYDRIVKKIASKIHIGFYNGTEQSYHTIDDYKSGVSYSIYRDHSGESCHVNDLEGNFPEDCIQKGSTYVGTSSLGDRAVEVDSWYVLNKEPGIDNHFVRSVQKEECVPIYSTNRAVDPETGATFHTASSRITDFKLGICDEDEIFHVPDICFERGLDAPKIPDRMRKIHRLSPTVTYVGE